MQIFSKQTKTQTLIRLSVLEKPDSLVFAISASCLIFFYLGPLMPFGPFSYFKTTWILKSSNLAPSLVLL
jgi:hypothetical protein